jgi:transposase
MNRLDSNAHRAALYRPAFEREVQQLAALSRLEVRQQRARPIAETLRAWMTEQRARVSDGWANANALDYSLRRWAALMRYLDDPHVPIDNNWCENQIRPIVMGRSLCTSF